jgi:hypothetical protein
LLMFLSKYEEVMNLSFITLQLIVIYESTRDVSIRQAYNYNSYNK